MTKARTNADNASADVQGVIAGTGLSGGGTSGTVTLTNDMATTINAAGDLLYGTANDAYTRLGIGTAGQYLKVNSGATAPEWATLSAGGMTLIEELTLSASTGASFSSIPGTYKQLMLVWSGLAMSATSDSFSLRFNNDSGANYAEGFLNYANSSGSVSNGGRTSVADGLLLGYQTNVTVLEQKASGFLILDNYASTTKLKTYQFNSKFRNPGSSENWFIAGSGVYNSTSAVSSLNIVRISGTVTITNHTNTSIRLYGVS